MDLHLAWHSNVDRDIESATLRNEAEIVRRLNFGVEKGTNALESWVLQSAGSMVQAGGVDGQAVIPADHLDELLDVFRRYQEDTEASVAVGVGVEPAEALTALTVARKRGGDPSIVLYTPEIAHEADENDDGELDPILDSETDALEGNAPVQAPVPGSMAKAQFGNQPSAGEATKIQQGALSASAAQPSAPSPVSPPPAPPADPNAQQQGGGQDLVQAVGQVLMDVKKQLPTLENLKKENPAAYESIVNMTQAVIALAQKLTGGQPVPGGAPVQKSEPSGALYHVLHRASGASHYVTVKRGYTRVPSEFTQYPSEAAALAHADEVSRIHAEPRAHYSVHAGVGEMLKGEVDPSYMAPDFRRAVEHEEKEHPDISSAMAKRLVRDHLKLDSDYYSKKFEKAEGVLHAPAPLKPTATGHHELHLPVGTARNGKVKVVHADGKTSWVEVKAGQITSEDGHAISSLNPGGR